MRSSPKRSTSIRRRRPLANRGVLIREYDFSDRNALERCVKVLLKAEHHLARDSATEQYLVRRHCRELKERVEVHQGKILVAVRMKKVVGFVAYRIIHRKDPMYVSMMQTYGYISDLCVLPEYRRLGIGEALLKHSEARIRGYGVHLLELDVDADNIEAQEFFRHAGFRARIARFMKKVR